MTELLYRDDPYLLEFDAAVVARREHQGRPAVVLDRTAFYCESGGQPWDTGTLGAARVVAVVENAGEVLHVLDRPCPAERVQGRVDAERRRDHRQQHHGQHLLSRAFVEVAQARTVSFHLGAAASAIDLDREVGSDAVRAAVTRANEVVWEARPITVRTVSRHEAQALGVASPEGAGEEIRLVEAQGFDLQPCGGTHPRCTAEVGVVLVLGQERYKGGSRLRFVCGHRALAAVTDRGRVLDRLCVQLSTPFEALPEAAQRLIEGHEDADRRSRDLLERALEGEARRLLATATGSPALVAATYEGWPAEDLRLLAQQIVRLGPSVALLASRGEKVHVVFAQSDGLPHDVPALLKDAVALLGGRGGGRGNLAQGGADDAARLDEALARAVAAVRANPR
ncbi:MAG: alanyl-tRNA editing protein [Acidobacteria bacterium]|nr:alanyl-tRNA editing protein [Acidobacteriota bacterium]